MRARTSYPFHEIEPKWQKHWDEQQSFKAANPGEPGSEKPKFYALDMFPYPSGAGLHVGHPEGYTATDIVSRYKRMKGFNVLHPMGWDAFGLPAEQYAVQTGTHPRITTEKNIATFKRQIKALGFSYDWSREVNTTDPNYYRWSQWIFIQLYNKGLAYISEAPVWYCPALGTVLANEEVLTTDAGPRSERGNHPVERRPLRQWMLKITAYAERLLHDLDGLDWPESLKDMQRNWIGRSEGARVKFQVAQVKAEIEVFTTRPDTLFGATYLVLAPEHALTKTITTESQRTHVETYIKQISSKTDLERTDLAKTKSGVFTGAYAVNPVNGHEIPIWIADYVLMGYGTGAIMAVPAHDERDHEFAQAYDLPIIPVVQATTPPQDGHTCFSGEGIAMNSGFLNNLPTADAKKKIITWLEEKKSGHGTINYKLRDWLFSRQRYWGEPFPIVWKDGQHRTIPESELPLLLPEMDDYTPSAEGLAPLSKAKDWLNLPDGSVRETNTMPQWAGSCWYYLRYCDPHNTQAPISREAESYWLGDQGVDLYIGGAEHAVLHLLYARFWHKVLFDLGVVSSPEPFRKLVNQGLILGEDGHKMSKSVGNVVNPDDVIEAYGADALRLFEMFMGPLEQVKPWSTKGVEGVYRFLGRSWRLVMKEDQEGSWHLNEALQDVPADAATLKALHKAIKKVTEDIECLSLNTAIAELMILTNELTKLEVRPKSVLESYILLLAPFAPHVAEELWEKCGHAESLSHAPWPQWDESLLIENEVEIIIQFNGKIRAKLLVDATLPAADYEAKARALPDFAQWLGDKQIRKAITVQGKLINFAIG